MTDVDYADDVALLAISQVNRSYKRKWYNIKEKDKKQAIYR